jgi:hypothetical protein
MPFRKLLEKEKGLQDGFSYRFYNQTITKKSSTAP